MSNETKHTPGPWGLATDMTVEAATGDTVAGLWVWTEDPYYSRRGGRLPKAQADAECRSNGHLIAAAPELLYACEAAEQCIADLIECIRRGAADVVCNQALASCQNDALPKLHTAIRKAKGEAP